MAKNKSTLRAEVRDYLDESTQSDWLDSSLNRLINKYYHTVVTAVMETFEDYYLTEATADTVADQQEYELPSDFFKIRRVEINYDIDNNNSAFSRAIRFNIDAIGGRLAKTSLGVGVLRNPGYYIQGDLIGFLPIPANNGDEAIKIWYMKYVPDMDGDTDEIDIPYPDRYYGIITKFAASEALRKGQQEPIEAKRLKDEAENDLEKMVRQLEDRIAEGGKTVVDTSGENLDFGSPIL